MQPNDSINDNIKIYVHTTIDHRSYSYLQKNGEYQLALDFTNSPYPYIQYYNWEVIGKDGINVSISNWGIITSSGVGEATIIGSYG